MIKSFILAVLSLTILSGDALAQDANQSYWDNLNEALTKDRAEKRANEEAFEKLFERELDTLVLKNGKIHYGDIVCEAPDAEKKHREVVTADCASAFVVSVYYITHKGAQYFVYEAYDYGDNVPFAHLVRHANQEKVESQDQGLTPYQRFLKRQSEQRFPTGPKF